jgi:hypothetical protein
MPMSKRLGFLLSAISLGAVVLFVVKGGVASAQTQTGGSQGSCIGIVFAIDCGGESTLVRVRPPAIQAPAPHVETVTPRSPTAPSVNYVSQTMVGTNAAGGQCLYQMAVPASQYLVAGLDRAGQNPFLNLTAGLPQCPAPPAPPAVVAAAGPAPPPVNPAVVAEQFFETIPLPAPRPAIPPGYALTGLAAYLVTNGDLRPAAYSRNTPVGLLSVQPQGAYYVDWGDGTRTGPYTTEGRPYPDGTISHVYDQVGTYPVTVTVEWSATWALGAAHGVLGGLRTQARIPDFVVRQSQAVLTG